MKARKARGMVGFLTVLVVAVTSASQTANQSKKTAAGRRPASSTFTCPEPEAKTSCKSYGELLKAKDAGLPSTGYVCFRRNADEFFAIVFTEPVFKKHWDSKARQFVVDDDATAKGLGYVTTYQNGVNDSRVQPNLLFTGTWLPLLGEKPDFSAETINRKKIEESDKAQSVSIDESQFTAVYKFQNAMDETITYSLTVQRSTGRFTEGFYEEAKQLSIAPGAGRCVSIQHGKPTR